MKLYKWLFTIGLIMIVLGLIVYSTANVWNTKSLVAILAGVILVIISLIRLDLRRLLRDRRFLYGGNVAIIILLVIGILGLLNFLSVRHSWRVDTSAGKNFSLSQQTTDLLKNLSDEVEVLAFEKNMNQAPLEDLLKEYRYISRNFKYRIIDPDEQPGIARKYNIDQYGSIVVVSGSREEHFSKLTEETLTNALIKVTRENTRKVAFVTGHGEASIKDADRKGYANAVAAIKGQNTEVIELILAEIDTISPEVSVVIIAGPIKEFFPGELDKLTKYLRNGGSVLFMLDPRPGISLANYMRNWYVEMGNDLVIDASGFGRLLGAGPEIPLVSNYGDHPIVKDLEGLMTFFPLIRSVQMVETDDPNIQVTEIAKTSQTSYAIDQANISDQAEISISPDDQRGPISIACATTIHQSQHPDIRIVTVGDSDFASNAYFTNQANGDFFMNIINWLMADEDLISIRPRAPETRPLNMTPIQARFVFWMVLIVFPVIAAALGIIVYRRKQ